VAEGAFVFITGRRQTELDRAKAALGNNAIAVQGDVSKVEDLDRLYEAVRDAKGTLDIVVANAGIVENLPIEAVTTGVYDRMFDINTRGRFFTVQRMVEVLCTLSTNSRPSLAQSCPFPTCRSALALL
jgi:NAD(P)-dependent dehydrogenase (short-subunit alcohol dehydrogenase family)